MTTIQNSQANAYLRTQVMSASAEQLRLMLLDGAIKFTRQGRQGLSAGNHEQSYEGFTQARAIISELMTSMRTDVAPELCQQVRSLYTFLYTELVGASMERDIARADRVIEMLGYERETWVMLMDSLKADRSGKPAAEPGAYRPISVQG